MKTFLKTLWGLCALLALVSGCMVPQGAPDWYREAVKDANGDRMKMSGEQVSPYSSGAGARLPG
jgi:hypothetical protein